MTVAGSERPWGQTPGRGITYPERLDARKAAVGWDEPAFDDQAQSFRRLVSLFLPP